MGAPVEQDFHFVPDDKVIVMMKIVGGGGDPQLNVEFGS
jgi:hypothetical protein